MKKITEMTEQEILNLTNEDIEKMQKLAMAEEGIAIMDKPRVPELFEIEEKDMTIYKIPLIGDEIGFTDLKEANELLEFLIKCKSFANLEYDWNKGGSDYKWVRQEKKRKYSSSEALTIEAVSAYSLERYTRAVDFILQNKRMQEQAEKELKQYNEAMESAVEITADIREAWLKVKEKYERLNSFCEKFKNDYLPLADGDTNMAIKFIAKAYSLTAEEQQYILDNLA